jgi:hypothetical protein
LKVASGQTNKTAGISGIRRFALDTFEYFVYLHDKRGEKLMNKTD